MGPKSQRSREIPTCCLGIPWNPKEWTGVELQNTLSFLCSLSLLFGGWILIHEISGWLSNPMLPKSFRENMSLAKYFYFAFTVFTFAWNPKEWTGDELQNMLSFLCSWSLFLGGLILIYENSGLSSNSMLPKGFRDLSAAKYFYFACAVFAFTWYHYDVHIYNPYYCRTSERRSSARTSRQRDTSRNSPAVPSSRSASPVDSGPEWPMTELEPGHPLVEGLRDLRELALATSYRLPLERFADGSMPPNKRRLMSLGEYAESRFY